MFLISFSSQLKDTLFLFSNIKYKVNSLLEKSDYTEVVCEVIKNGADIKFKLKDIFQENKLQFFNSNDIILLSKAYSKKKPLVPELSSNKKYYNLLTVTFVVCLLLSNIAEIKMCDFFGYTIGAGTIIFPLLYILNDVLTEVYGFLAARRAIWLALCFNIIFSIFLYIIALLPASQYWQDQQAFETIFYISPRIVTASVLSYFIGELINAIIIASLKIKFNGRMFALRAILSTFIGAFIESTIFGYIAFFGRIPSAELMKMIYLLTVIKVLYEILTLPITVKFVAFLKRADRSDVFEKPSFKQLIPNFLK
ncbi:queuosine precursor transporter [Candidatus Tisiphia endosymbiont of Ditula angustiorana]|uniref:queuosine precursor transporter n=1 Tax=Candidatus Tisiphia endosymbiont of Ditula angustiorana TaxID=3066272 RepID=UPI00312C878C